MIVGIVGGIVGIVAIPLAVLYKRKGVGNRGTVNAGNGGAGSGLNSFENPLYDSAHFEGGNAIPGHATIGDGATYEDPFGIGSEGAYQDVLPVAAAETNYGGYDNMAGTDGTTAAYAMPRAVMNASSEAYMQVSPQNVPDEEV